MASHFSSRKPVAFICSAQSALNTPTTTPSPSPPLHLPDSLPRKKTTTKQRMKTGACP